MKNILIISSKQIIHCLSINAMGRCLKKNNFQVDLLASANAAFVCKGSTWINQWVTEKILAGDEAAHPAKYSFVIDNKGIASLPASLKTSADDKGEIRAYDTIYMDVSSFSWLKAREKMLAATATQDDGLGWNLVIPPENKITENDIPTGHLPGYIVLALDKSDSFGDVKKWSEFIKSVDFPFILIGNQENFDLAAKIATIDNAKIYNACGKFNLYEMTDIIQRGRLLLTHETLWMYLGLAVKQKIVAINSRLAEKEILNAYGAVFYNAQKEPAWQNLTLKKRWFFPNKHRQQLEAAVNTMLKLKRQA